MDVRSELQRPWEQQDNQCMNRRLYAVNLDNFKLLYPNRPSFIRSSSSLRIGAWERMSMLACMPSLVSLDSPRTATGLSHLSLTTRTVPQNGSSAILTDHVDSSGLSSCCLGR